MGARLGALGALGALALALTPLLAAGAGAPLLAGSSPTAQPRWGGDGDWGGAGRRGLRQEPLDPHLPAAPAGPKDDPFADVRPPGLAAQPAPATAPANGTAPFEGRAAPANASSSAAQGAAGEAAAAAEPADIGPVVPVPEVAPGEAESAEAEAAEGRLQAELVRVRELRQGPGVDPRTVRPRAVSGPGDGAGWLVAESEPSGGRRPPQRRPAPPGPVPHEAGAGARGRGGSGRPGDLRRGVGPGRGGG